jgi:DNA-binding NarL/FixJ family response regulator
VSPPGAGLRHARRGGGQATRVVVADSDCGACTAVETVLREYCDSVVTVNEPSGLDSALSESPKCVLFLRMIWNGVFAPRLLSVIRRRFPAVRVCIHTEHSIGSCIAASFRAGADGYLVKPVARGELLTAMTRILEGERYVSPAASGLPGLLEAVERGWRYRSPLARLVPGAPDYHAAVEWLAFDLWLAPAEARIALALSEGKPKKQVARLLGCSEATVASRVGDMYMVLRSAGVTNVAALSQLVAQSLLRMPGAYRTVVVDRA